MSEYYRLGSRDSFGLVCVGTCRRRRRIKLYWSVLRTEEILYVEKKLVLCGSKKNSKNGVDEQLSVRFFAAGEREGTRMKISPG